MRNFLPQWEEMSPARRFFDALILPSAFGLLCGLALGVSGALYLIGVIIALFGGIGGGAQYARRGDALIRGLVSGALFGAFILLGFELGGEDEAKVDLPDPHVVLLVFTVVPSLFLHWLGWRLRPRLLRSRAETEAA
ncbi:MAG TPA: hypothetical protein VI035_06905 [Solirubrobacterales bacterium]